MSACHYEERSSASLRTGDTAFHVLRLLPPDKALSRTDISGEYALPERMNAPLESSLLTALVGNVVKRRSDLEADLKMYDFS